MGRRTAASWRALHTALRLVSLYRSMGLRTCSRRGSLGAWTRCPGRAGAGTVDGKAQEGARERAGGRGGRGFGVGKEDDEEHDGGSTAWCLKVVVVAEVAVWSFSEVVVVAVVVVVVVVGGEGVRS